MISMELFLQREKSKLETTLGKLKVNGDFECHTLEDEVRVDDPITQDVNEGKKIYGKTAIPAGRYRVDITWSPKFKKYMIIILDVPDYTGIRMHSGNDAEDTLGCVLVGTTVDSSRRIHGGTQALPKLYAKIAAALKKGEVWITIANG